jgi:hypothetical protein
MFAAAGKEKQKSASYALVAGTVFRDTGYSLAGAELDLVPAGQAQSGRKTKAMKAVSDARGEFAFRVPPFASEYKLMVRAAGYENQEKPVTIGGEERVDVFFRLEPASKK